MTLFILNNVTSMELTTIALFRGEKKQLSNLVYFIYINYQNVSQKNYFQRVNVAIVFDI